MSSTPSIHTASIHPIVLLSVVDHHYRVAEGTQRRVIGVLLGTVKDGVCDVTNCYAVPFEEDTRNDKIWFVDHNFHEKMHAMFRKVNASEKVVGWYSSGPKIKANDIEINELFRRYTKEPVFCVIQAKSTELGLPTKSYVSVEKVNSDGTSEMSFAHIESRIEAVEAEEVGVEHLLRDIHDTSVSTLTTQVREKITSLKSLVMKLSEIERYLNLVVEGKIPSSAAVMDQLQQVFNESPNLGSPEYVEAFAVKTNDSMLALYLSSLIRSVVALHDLINNRIENREFEKKTFGFVDEDEQKKQEKKGDVKSDQEAKKSA